MQYIYIEEMYWLVFFEGILHKMLLIIEHSYYYGLIFLRLN